MRYFRHAIRILLGLMFITSGVTKLFPIAAFDAKILEQATFLGWTLSAIAARTIIGTEITLGILLISGIAQKKVVLPATIAIMSFFTAFVIVAIIRFGNQQNCGCFGVVLPFTNLQSLIKNIIILSLTVFLYIKSPADSTHLWWISLIVLAATIATVFIFNNITIYDDDFEITDEIKATHLHQHNFSTDTVDLHARPHIAVFLSTGCPYCRQMAKDLKTIDNIYHFESIYVFVKLSDTTDNIGMLLPNGEFTFPYVTVPRDTFATYLAAPYLPLIGLVENDCYTHLWTSSNFNFDKVIALLRDKKLLKK